MKKAYIIVNRYPNKFEPNICVFIQQLVWSFVDLGIDCKVIAPLPINLNFNYLSLPYERYEINENGKKIAIFHPRYISFGQKGVFLQKTRVFLTTLLYKKAVEKVLKKEKKIDSQTFFYSHFVFPCGVVTGQLGHKYNIKSFMAHGEAIYGSNKKYTHRYLKRSLGYLKGVIAVSIQNKNFLVNDGVVNPNKIKVFPNGFREERFYKLDKKSARDHFNWPYDKFIVGFCGSFDDRKGILRLQEAVDIQDDVYFACAGSGEQIPTSKKCIFKWPVKNEELVYFYNALDIFVLPTQNEGCCNAIVEAMACGCPIISSDREFNYDILDNSNSILIDPNDVNEIKNAIAYLKRNANKRKKMAISSLNKSKKLTLKKRAKSIIDFINS